MSYLATFLGTSILYVLMCRKAVNQLINLYAIAFLRMPSYATEPCDPFPFLAAGHKKGYFGGRALSASVDFQQ